MDKTIRITMNDSMSPCLRQQAHRFCLTLFNQLVGKHMFRTPKALPSYKTPNALCYAPDCELSNILPCKKKPPEDGVASGGFSRFAGKVSGDRILLLSVLLMPDRESARPPRRHRSRLTPCIGNPYGIRGDTLYRQNLPFPIFSLIFKVRR